MSSPQQPSFITTLLSSPPIPCITPGPIQAKHGYNPSLASLIVDGLYHPAIEVGLHLLNGDLYSAHFVVRKMQNDHYGMWLHGILHRYEGDLSNAKAWYSDIPESILSQYPGHLSSTSTPKSDTPAHETSYLLIDKVGIHGRSLSLNVLLAQYDQRSISTPPAPSRSDLESQVNRLKEEAKKETDRECWEELKWLVGKLGDMYGWDKNVEGTKGYTESTEKQKEISRRMVGGGEGIRKF